MNSVNTPRAARGQGMVEYIIIVALIALAAIGAFSYFGKSVRGQTAQMAQQVAGQNVTTGRTAAEDGANKALTEGQSNINLNNYVDHDD
jgi:pilus assembly protein Flp/PilA